MAKGRWARSLATADPVCTCMPRLVQHREGTVTTSAGAAVVSEANHDRADSAFLHLHRASLALLHRLAAAEDFLEAKAHALLGIGRESSPQFYSHLSALVRPRAGPLQAHGLAALLAPLVEHDRALLAGRRAEWLRRDWLMATQVLLRHLAVAVHRERPQFTLVDPDANDEVRAAVLSAVWLGNCTTCQAPAATCSVSS